MDGDYVASVEQDIVQIREAVYGKDVREAIADGMFQINSSAKAAVQVRNELKGNIIDLQNELRTDVTNMQSLLGDKVNKPTNEPYGTDGQVLKTNGRGETRWENPETPTQAQITAAVDQWMDDHPEASTTVQDGAVTFAKLGVDINRAQFVKNIAELRESTADYVYVIENDSKVSDLNSSYGPYVSNEPFTPNRGGCWFWKHSNNAGGTTNIEIYGGYLRTNGDVMFAMPDQGNRTVNSNDALSALFDTFASYYNRNNFIYGRNKTLFTDDCTPNSDGKYEIDCASLLLATIQGINYESSRYVRGSEERNINYSTGIKLPSTRGQNCLYLNELVEYFAERKCLFTIQTEGLTEQEIVQKNGIMPGDIIFHSTEGAAEPLRRSQYYRASHAVLVLAVYPEEGSILVAEAGGENTGKKNPSILSQVNFGWVDNDDSSSGTLRIVKISQINFSRYAGSVYVVFARPSYLPGRAVHNISGRFNDYGEVATTAINQWVAAGQIFPSVLLKPGRIYSLSVKGTLPRFETDDEYLALLYHYREDGSSTDKYALVHPWMMSNSDGRTMFTAICIPYDTPMSRIQSIIIRVRSRDSQFGHVYHIEEASLYDGISFGSEGSRLFAFTQDSSFANTVTNQSYKCGDKTVIDLSFTPTGEANSLIKIGKFEHAPNGRLTGELVLPGTIARVNPASLTIRNDGEVYYATSATSTGAAVFRAII